MFGKNKNAILTTTLIVKVRKYKNNQPYLSFAVQGGDSQDQNLLQFYHVFFF